MNKPLFDRRYLVWGMAALFLVLWSVMEFDKEFGSVVQSGQYVEFF